MGFLTGFGVDGFFDFRLLSNLSWGVGLETGFFAVDFSVSGFFTADSGSFLAFELNVISLVDGFLDEVSGNLILAGRSFSPPVARCFAHPSGSAAICLRSSSGVNLVHQRANSSKSYRAPPLGAVLLKPVLVEPEIFATLPLDGALLLPCSGRLSDLAPALNFWETRGSTSCVIAAAVVSRVLA